MNNNLANLLARSQGKKVITQKKTKPKVPDYIDSDGLAESLVKGLDRFLIEKNIPQFRQYTDFHPSSTNLCKRWAYLRFEGAEVEKKIPPRLQRIFDNGHDVHARYQRYFEEMGILIEAEKEIKITDPVPIKGSVDGILNWTEHIPYELKSISPERFEFRRAYKKPDENTYRQAQLYVYALDHDSIFVIYENKGTQEILIFHIPRDDEFIKKELRRLTKIWEMYQSGLRPKRPYARESKHCQDCDLEKYCWEVIQD